MGAVVIGIGAALAALGIVFGVIGFGSAETTSGAGLMMVGSTAFVGGLLMVALGFILRVLGDIAEKLEGAVHVEPFEDEHPAGRMEAATDAVAGVALAPVTSAFEDAPPARAPQELPLVEEERAPPAWFGRKRAAEPPSAGEAAFEPEREFAPEPEFEPEYEPLPPFRSPLAEAARRESTRAEPVRTEPLRSEPLRAETVRPEPQRHEPLRHEPLRPEPPRHEPVRPDAERPEPLRVEPARSEPFRPEPPRSEPVRNEPARTEPLRRDPPGFLRPAAGAGLPVERPAPAIAPAPSASPAAEEVEGPHPHEPFLPEPDEAPPAFLREADLLVDEPAPAPETPSVTVLKSGTIGGMSYTLYSDGSIEADLPDGVLRFASLQELRDHVAGAAARD
ncbi:hypothetical protein [Ancylobacter vacuolatus]|uniref:Uncharacterized protein n=1 Tax=Ancylobacter vacuolatus TaxID=223389 RepID=A0ABU0DFX2_9HYPH|nr:hypothetical protein [Ancylobacter vacuolatus]MDQ0347233.1 hypothetical protein [Ancylobacter vacuolatus]